jgi:hypothetical protein
MFANARRRGRTVPVCAGLKRAKRGHFAYITQLLHAEHAAISPFSMVQFLKAFPGASRTPPHPATSSPRQNSSPA